jgi:hypothetical protein
MTNTRFREVLIDDHGDLVWHGHDLGPAVGSLMSGATEYEFWRYVRAADVPALRAALGAGSSDDVARLVEQRFASDVDLDAFAKSNEIETTFQSWITTD